MVKNLERSKKITAIYAADLFKLLPCVLCTFNKNNQSYALLGHMTYLFGQTFKKL